jgi:hypothetical protein
MNRAKTAINKKNSYLTKRVLMRAIGKATRSVSSEAMHLKGYVVQVEKGWVVKIDKQGKREKIARLKRTHTNKKVALD